MPAPELAASAPPLDGIRAADLRVCVICATRGRPEILARMVTGLERQSLRPTAIIVSCSTQADAGTLRDRAGLIILHGKTGACVQRNAALRYVPPDTDVVVFFDDDFLPHADWLAQVAALLAAHPDIGAVTGAVAADGIKGPGLTMAEAETILEGAAGRSEVTNNVSPYGCNMAFRVSAIAGLAFDERLVLYGWQEDRDFGAMVARRGYRLVKCGTAVGVHLGAKIGRGPGHRLGYSQMVNPIYLHGKGTMSFVAVADHLFRNFLSNLLGAVRPEPFIDRRGRLQGNLRGLSDLLRGVVEPERAAQL